MDFWGETLKLVEISVDKTEEKENHA